MPAYGDMTVGQLRRLLRGFDDDEIIKICREWKAHRTVYEIGWIEGEPHEGIFLVALTKKQADYLNEQNEEYNRV